MLALHSDFFLLPNMWTCHYASDQSAICHISEKQKARFCSQKRQSGTFALNNLTKLAGISEMLAKTQKRLELTNVCELDIDVYIFSSKLKFSKLILMKAINMFHSKYIPILKHYNSFFFKCTENWFKKPYVRYVKWRMKSRKWLLITSEMTLSRYSRVTWWNGGFHLYAKVFNTLNVVKTEIKRLKMRYFKKYADLNMQKMCMSLKS